MRSFRSKLYLIALVMFVWAQFGIVRADLPNSVAAEKATTASAQTHAPTGLADAAQFSSPLVRIAFSR